MDDIARRHRENLQSSLGITTNLSSSGKDALDYLLLKMNHVLQSAVDTNFNTRDGLSKVADLHKSIVEVEPHLTDKSQTLSLVHFARSFAVVFDEALKVLEKHEWSTTTAKNNSDAKSWATATPAQSGSQLFADKAGNNKNNKNNNDSSGHFQDRSAYGRPPTAGSATNVSRPQPLMSQPRAYRHDELDYSPEAIMGRIIVRNIPSSFKMFEVRKIFEDIGKLEAFHMPVSATGHKGFAQIKYPTNALANEAVSDLNGYKIGDAALRVTRAKFWFCSDNEVKNTTKKIEKLSVKEEKADEEEKGEAANEYPVTDSDDEYTGRNRDKGKDEAVEGERFLTSESSTSDSLVDGEEEDEYSN